MEPNGINPMWMLAVAGVILTILLGTLLAVLGWIGNKVYEKVTEISDSIMQMKNDLHGKISDLDRRQTRVETQLELHLDSCECIEKR